ncbi:MAG: hypothetical protein QOE88_524 [Verrucomicrobiota bacterium]|jgi:hypothetical protein|nr:hypothetical protein [Verrucomicrobiota bacterium]
MAKNFQPLIDELRVIIENSRTGRLSAPDEQKGASLFKELVMSGGKPLSSAMELLGDLPWFVPVNGALEAWPQLTPAKQRSFFAALKPLASEASRRMRLSIARGLHKLDPAAALKLIVATLESLRTEAGLDLKDRQIFYSVLIGKNKPWLLQLDLKSLKPAEAQLVALTAMECAAGANPPATVAVIQWAKPFQPLSTIPEHLQQDLGKIFRKWSPRWQKQLSEEDWPPALKEILQAKSVKPIDENLASPAPEPPPQSFAPQEPVQHSQQHNRRRPQHQQGRPQAPAPGENRHEKSHRQRLEKPPPHHQKSGVEVPELLKQLQAQFEDLREELQSAKNQLRQSHQPARQGEVQTVETNREAAKLREENQRLTETVAALRETLSDLASDNFDQAISRKADSGAPMTDPVDQYKSFLTLKVREQIVNIQTLNRENNVDALPLLLDNILRTLQENGIDLENIETPPPLARRKY